MSAERELEIAEGGPDDGADSDAPSRPYRLSEEQVQQITARLRAGKALPPYLLPHLFERPREYELTYAGKMRSVDVVAETMALPLQPVKTFGEAQDGFDNMLVLGDNLQVLRTLLSTKEQGQLRNADGSHGVRLCYIDPPFATRREFTGRRNAPAFEDRVAGAEFVEYLRRRLILIYELLSADGTLYVHLDTRKAHYVKVVLDEIFGEEHFLNELIWQRSTAHNMRTKGYARTHETLLVYRKGTEFIYNQQLVPYSEAQLARYKKDEDGRLYKAENLTFSSNNSSRQFEWRGTKPPAHRSWGASLEQLEEWWEEGRILTKRDGTPRMDGLKIYLDDTSGGSPLSTIWTDIARIGNTSSERVNYPTQKPLALLNRIIEASSNPGDLVLDCFCGSGTTLVAAQTASDGPRRWIGIDCGKFAIYTTQARLLRLDTANGAQAEPFTTYNAGLYDYTALRGLDWTDYRAFALRLFQCRDEPHEVGGFRFDGVFQDEPVHVFNFKAHDRDVTIGRAYADDLSAAAGNHLGDRCFIIAPALTVEPYEDYIDVNGTRFFFLRIPYSVIAELHKRAFSGLRQPSSEQVANATIDAVGFDFVQPPKVEASYRARKDELVIEIERFASQAYSADESEEPISDLAMVMIDFAYDGEVFDLDAVHYADDLERAKWRLSIPRREVGDQLMIVYLDTYGNEHREAKVLGDFASA